MDYESINPLNAELNLICHLLILLGAHHILHVSRVRVNLIKWIYLIHKIFYFHFCKYGINLSIRESLK